MSCDEVRTELEYRDRIEGLEQRIMELEFDLEKKEQEIDGLRTDLESCENDLATERSQRASILGEIEDIAKSINALVRNN